MANHFKLLVSLNTVEIPVVDGELGTQRKETLGGLVVNQDQIHKMSQTLWQARKFYFRVIESPIDICYKDKAMQILNIIRNF